LLVTAAQWPGGAARATSGGTWRQAAAVVRDLPKSWRQTGLLLVARPATAWLEGQTAMAGGRTNVRTKSFSDIHIIIVYPAILDYDRSLVS
jgi:hypothetical protein